VISGIINLFKSICEGDFKAMCDAIKEIFNGAIKLIIGLIEGWLVMGALKSFKGMFTSIKTGVMSMWNSVTSFFKNGVKGCINSITNLVKTGVNNFNTLRTFGANIFSALFQAVKSSMSNLGVAVKTSINNVLSFLRGINLASIGKNMIQGLVNGVKSMAKSLLGAVQGVVGGAIEKAKNLLGINSPSKLFMQFGEWTTEGYEIGVNRGEKSSTRSVEDFANNSINAFTTTALPASSNNSNSSIDNSNYTININAGSLNSEKDMYKLAQIIDRKLAEIKQNKSISRGGARVVY
jgi:phage-related protein